MIKFISRPNFFKIYKNKEFYKSYTGFFIRLIYAKITKKKYTRKKYSTGFFSSEEGNQEIKQSLLYNFPTLVARFGNSELLALIEIEAKKHNLIKTISNKSYKYLVDTTGFYFSNNKNKTSELIKFYDLMISSLKNVDYLASFDFSMEDYFVEKYNKSVQLLNPLSLEPYYFNDPWSIALKDKNVLIIHPFKDTIDYQYKIKDKLFENKNILPDFQIKTYRALQTIGGKGSFDSWFDGLNFMLDEIEKIDYEIAIVGCGAYGFPLSSKLKERGKKVIHMGGSLQLLFGIHGKRWEKNEKIKILINKHWTKPHKNDTPCKFEDIKYKAYW